MSGLEFLEIYTNIPTTETQSKGSSKGGPSEYLPNGIVAYGVVFLLLSNIPNVFRTLLVNTNWIIVTLPEYLSVLTSTPKKAYT